MSCSSDYELSVIGKSDKPSFRMFVTNHFNKTKENTRYIQPSIMQHRIIFTEEFYQPSLILHSANSSVGGRILKNILCHVANLSLVSSTFMMCSAYEISNK
jgi:hypothetical protein